MIKTAMIPAVPVSTIARTSQLQMMQTMAPAKKKKGPFDTLLRLDKIQLSKDLPFPIDTY